MDRNKEVYLQFEFEDLPYQQASDDTGSSRIGQQRRSFSPTTYNRTMYQHQCRTWHFTIETTVTLPEEALILQLARPMNLLASLQQRASLHCSSLDFTPPHANQWFTGAEAIFNVAFFFDPPLRLFKVVHALVTNTKSDMLKLVEVSPSAAALASVKSIVLRHYIATFFWVREKQFLDLVVNEHFPIDLMQ